MTKVMWDGVDTGIAVEMRDSFGADTRPRAHVPHLTTTAQEAVG